MKNILFISVTLLFTSCSSFFKKDEIAEAKVDQVTPVIKRIVGSANVSEGAKHHLKTYYLYGAEQLGLDNYYFDIPIVYNAAVKKWVKYFLTRGRKFFERYGQRAGRYAPILGSILEQRGLPRDLIFLAMAESGFSNSAKSWARAVGPWQFMPYTGRRYDLKINWYIDERRDPIKSTHAAASYLTKLYNDFGAWELAAAAYNAGEGKMRRAIRRYKSESFWKIRKGRYLKSETKNYVPKIMALAIIGKNLKTFGFDDIDFYDPLEYDEIEVSEMTDLDKIAAAIDIPSEEIFRLNPEVLRWFTPPGRKYTLRVPTGYADVFKKLTAGNYRATDFRTYVVGRRGARSLNRIARKYRIKDKVVLRNLNKNLSRNGVLPRGSVVNLPFKVTHSLRDNMYADLYERPRKAVRRRKEYRKWLNLNRRKRIVISSPSKYHVVRKGDTLWNVARNNGITLNTLISTNYDLLKKRMIRAGDKLVIR